MNGPAPDRSIDRGWNRGWKRDLLVGAALYALALVVILIEIGSRPPFPYNWENYTLWQGFPFWDSPTLDALDLTDGLMTDSGRSWLVVGPAWVVFELAGMRLDALRVSTGLIAALSAPLTWLLGRRITTGLFTMPGWRPEEQARIDQAARWAALIGAALLPLLASWLVYARTATLVGLSVAPALATVLLIDQVRRLDRRWWLWLLLLQGALLLGAWAYAPIRFLYPLAAVVFALELLFNSRRWRAYAIAIVVTVVTLPALLATIDQEPAWRPLDAISRYYNARGEQVLALRESPEDYRFYLRDADIENSSTGELERQLIEQNARDLARLLLDIETRPALTDFWNQTGRLLPWFLVPLMLLGLVVSALRLWRSPDARLLHLMFWGFTLPMIGTSKVHIGRLVFAMPFLCLFIGIGAAGIAWGLTHYHDLRRPHRPLLRFVAPALGLALLTPAAVSAWNDYHVPVPVSREARLAEVLEANQARYAETGGVVWVSGGRDQAQVEAISLAATRIAVAGDYQFVNLALGESPEPADPRPVVYFGGITDVLSDPARAPRLCALPWLTPADPDPLEGVPAVCESADVERVP
jgi:hypothetical protein